MSFFIVEAPELQKVERAAKRLFTEQRMSGDEMRDMAQLLELFVRRAREIEYHG